MCIDGQDLADRKINWVIDQIEFIEEKSSAIAVEQHGATVQSPTIGFLFISTFWLWYHITGIGTKHCRVWQQRILVKLNFKRAEIGSINKWLDMVEEVVLNNLKIVFLFFISFAGFCGNLVRVLSRTSFVLRKGDQICMCLNISVLEKCRLAESLRKCWKKACPKLLNTCTRKDG